VPAARNVLRQGAGKSFSGPLARGDVRTVAAHLETLGATPEAAVYQALMEYATAALPVKRSDEMKKLPRNATWLSASLGPVSHRQSAVGAARSIRVATRLPGSWRNARREHSAEDGFISGLVRRSFEHLVRHSVKTSMASAAHESRPTIPLVRGRSRTASQVVRTGQEDGRAARRRKTLASHCRRSECPGPEASTPCCS